MRPLPVRRRGIALMTLGIVFFALAATFHHGAYIGVGACLLIVGLAVLRRGA